MREPVLAKPDKTVAPGVAAEIVAIDRSELAEVDCAQFVLTL